MPKITVLPHPDCAPSGAEITANRGEFVCNALLRNGLELDHACGKVGACTTCHIVVKDGFDSLNPSDENEEDMLDRAWGLQSTSRLSCQARIGDADLIIEIPKYSINHAKENA